MLWSICVSTFYSSGGSILVSHYWWSPVCLCDCLCESECWLNQCCWALDMPHFLVDFRFALFYSSENPNFSQSYFQCQNFLTSNILSFFIYIKGIKILFMTVRCNFKYLLILFCEDGCFNWMYVCVPCECLVPLETKEGSGYPETGVR